MSGNECIENGALCTDRTEAAEHLRDSSLAGRERVVEGSPSLLSGRVGRPRNWTAGNVERGDNGFSFQCVDFAVSVGCPNGRVSQAAGYESEVQGKAWRCVLGARH